MSYTDYVTQDRRLVILRILRGLESRRANHFVLRAALAEHGYRELPETVYNDLRWLASQGLTFNEELAGGMLLALVTPLGEQTADGLVRVKGVAVPQE